MQTILIIIMTVLILMVIYQGKQVRKLEEKTLKAFHIICRDLKK